MWRPKTLVLWTILCCGGLPGSLGAQQPATPSPQNPGQANQNPIAVNPITGLASTPSRAYRPLTAEQRWRLYWKQNYWSVGAYFGPFITAVILDQTTNSPSQWGGGVPGLSRRFGSRLGIAITQGTIQAGLAAPLHMDVRYLSSGQTGFKRRTLHAIAFTFVTYNNQGHTTLNIPYLTGYYGASAISTLWVPIHRSVATYTLINASTQIGLSIPVNIIQEFWPEIRHKILRRP